MSLADCTGEKQYMVYVAKPLSAEMVEGVQLQIATASKNTPELLVQSWQIPPVPVQGEEPPQPTNP